MSSPVIRETKACLFNFTIKNVAGVVDTTTVATLGSSNPAAMKVVINPDNPRQAAIVVLSFAAANQANPIVAATVTAFGHSQQTTFTLAAAPDLSSVTIDSVGAEIDPPSWAQ